MSATYRKDVRGVVRVLDAARYRVRHPLARLATCGACGRTWDDAVCTRWTPAPSGRCPWEERHNVQETRDENTGRLLATTKPASEEAVKRVLALPVDDATDWQANGRSPWVWLRLPNGDLMLGVWPHGDAYFDCEKEAP